MAADSTNIAAASTQAPNGEERKNEQVEVRSATTLSLLGVALASSITLITAPGDWQLMNVALGIIFFCVLRAYPEPVRPENLAYQVAYAGVVGLLALQILGVFVINPVLAHDQAYQIMGDPWKIGIRLSDAASLLLVCFVAFVVYLLRLGRSRVGKSGKKAM